MRTVLIGNPVAGRKGGLPTNASTIDAAVAALHAVGVVPDVWLTRAPDDPLAFARRAVAEGYERIIGAGGDGTVEAIAQALVGTPVSLGVMPLGSVMNLARTLGIPRDLHEAARLIASGHLLCMDVGQANDRYFLEYAGVGLDAALYPLTERLDSGQWASLRDLLRVVLRYRPQKVTVSIDGEVHTLRALLVVVANTPYLGPAVELTPEAKVDDARLDVKVFDRFSLLELVRYGVQLLRGQRPRHPRVYCFRGRTVAVSSSRPLPAHADIQPVGTTPITFRVVPRALRVIANPTLWRPSELSPVSRPLATLETAPHRAAAGC
ncbi:MAG TPA: diacylglycerol kinase family protein [Chloroflexota bacterium]|nr:diacylglycerol kinase family protein [Chloroflexota bacterium]